MKEKIYVWLSLINVILFTIILYFVSIHHLWDYILVKILSIVFLTLFLLFIFGVSFDGWIKNKYNFLLNIFIGIITIFLFNYQPILSSIVLLIFFLLPLLLDYQYLEEDFEFWKKKLNVFFQVSWIIMIMQLCLLQNDSFKLSYILYYLILIISFTFLFSWKLSWMKFKKRFWSYFKRRFWIYWIYLIHFLAFLFCLPAFCELLHSFQWDKTGWDILISVFIFLMLLFPFSLTIFNLLYLNVLDETIL